MTNFPPAAPALYRQRHLLSAHKAMSVQRDKHPLKVFCANDYLGMAQHPEVVKAFVKGAEKYGVGGVSSQLVCGHLDIHREVELAFADFLQRDNALLFSCGYMANLGVIPALAKNYQRLLLDKYAHASLIDAAKLSGLPWRRFPHRQYQSLQSCDDKTLVITDSVFSMLGDLADLPLCAQLTKHLLVDDAHGIGILGKQGGGVSEYFHLSQQEIPFLICPLGKAFGVMGAIVAGSHDFIDYLQQSARSYIYTHAIPPALAASALKSLQIVREENWRREKLQALIAYFKKKAESLSLPLSASDTPIQAIIVGDPHSAKQLADNLLEAGILLNSMRPPSIPAPLSCLRITLSCLHEESDIDYLLNSVRNYYDALSSP